MWSGYATLIIIFLWFLGFIVGAIKLEIKENKRRKKYGK